MIAAVVRAGESGGPVGSLVRSAASSSESVAASAPAPDWRVVGLKHGAGARAGLETFGLVHEHKSVTFFNVSCMLPERAKKACAKDQHGGAHHHGRDARRLRGGRRWRLSRVVDPHHDHRGERRSSFPSFPMTFPTMCPNVNR